MILLHHVNRLVPADGVSGNRNGIYKFEKLYRKVTKERKGDGRLKGRAQSANQSMKPLTKTIIKSATQAKRGGQHTPDNQRYTYLLQDKSKYGLNRENKKNPQTRGLRFELLHRCLIFLQF
jgi:hypothetical protein